MEEFSANSIPVKLKSNTVQNSPVPRRREKKPEKVKLEPMPEVVFLPQKNQTESVKAELRKLSVITTPPSNLPSPVGGKFSFTKKLSSLSDTLKQTIGDHTSNLSVWTNADQEVQSQSSKAFEKFGQDTKNMKLLDVYFPEDMQFKTSAVIRYQDRTNPFWKPSLKKSGFFFMNEEKLQKIELAAQLESEQARSICDSLEQNTSIFGMIPKNGLHQGIDEHKKASSKTVCNLDSCRDIDLLKLSD